MDVNGWFNPTKLRFKMITVIFLFTAACYPQCGNPDLNFGILSDRYSYVFLGILSGILSDICTDILFAIASMGETWGKSCTVDGGHACTVVHSGAKLPLGGISLDKKTRHRKKPD